MEEELDSGVEDEEERTALEKQVGGSARSRRHRAPVTYKEEEDDVGVVSDDHEEDAALELGENTEGDAASEGEGDGVEGGVEGEEEEDMQVVNGKKISKYEAERLAKIARNQGILQQLGLAQAASKIAQGVFVCRPQTPSLHLTPFPSSLLLLLINPPPPPFPPPLRPPRASPAPVSPDVPKGKAKRSSTTSISSKKKSAPGEEDEWYLLFPPPLSLEFVLYRMCSHLEHRLR